MKKPIFLLKGGRGDGFPMTIAVTLVLLLIFCGISEYFRVSIISQGVRDSVQQAVISTINDNYDDIYHAAREGYAAGYAPTDEDWEESLDTGDIYSHLTNTLGLIPAGGGYAKHAGDELEFTVSSLTVTLSNNGLASGQSEGFLAEASILLEVPARFIGTILPPIRMTLKVQAKYMPLF
jgi:hypothetical protein